MNDSIEINQKLAVLYDLLVDNFEKLELEIVDLIANPGKIENTNKFASLISDLNKPIFISPLLYMIVASEEGDRWLTDFLYAAINLLHENSIDDEFDTPKNLIDKLGKWMLENTGELAWKAAGLLKFSYSEHAERVQLKKLEQNDDFFLTYVECIIGLLWYDKKKHIELVKQIANDETRNKDLREYCSGVIERDQ